MSVPKESNLAGGIQQAFERLRRRKDVFVFILKRTVYQNDSLGFQRALRKAREPPEIFIGKLRASPIHSGFGHGIEIIGGHQLGDSLVVIAPDRYGAQFADAGSDFVGIRAVTHDIAKANQALPATLSGAERGIQSGKICMDIRKD